MLIAVAVVATFLMAFWVLMLFLVDSEDWRAAAFAQMLCNLDQIGSFHQKALKNQERLANYSGLQRRFMRHIYEEDFTKKIQKLEHANEELQNGKLSHVSLFLMPGYAMQRKLPWIGSSRLFKKAVQNYVEWKGRKYAIFRTKDLFAKMLSYQVIGTAGALLYGIFLSVFLGQQIGMAFGGIATLAALALAFVLYGEALNQLKKRREAIRRQFPNAVSKLALLVTSGMIMDKAWKKTAYSQSSELYLEMQKTSEELDNLIAPEAAYTNFINRCNTKETAKLASAILQNLSKGNAEIGKLLKELAQEAWAMRQHMARKDGEKANEMLLIPTLLLFVSILIMIIVPALTNMNI